MQKIRTATMTFHASHNYGSMLQAYALQYILTTKLGVENEIINFRSEKQKLLYPFPSSRDYSLKRRLIRRLLGVNEKALIEKYNLFEKFLDEKLNISKEFNNENDVAEYAAKHFDYIISGSDQIWNTNCDDFNWLYFLPFSSNNAIAYAPSMGPSGLKNVKQENISKISECLHKYKAISVREKGTAKAIKELSTKNIEVLVDPTLLVEQNEWDNISGSKPLISGDYIFMYHPFINDSIYKISKKISKIKGMPVIVSNKFPARLELYNQLSFTNSFVNKLDCGPIEFINLIKNAKLVISGSFHAVVFSIIFNKPFLALGGKTDNRMSHLLEYAGLLDYSISINDYLSALNILPKISFEKAKSYIEYERNKSISFLKSSLGI